MHYIPDAPDAATWSIREGVRSGAGVCTSIWGEASTAELATIFRHLRLLAVAGHPPEREKLHRVSLAVGYCHLDATRRISIHELKSKPTPWRTYYVADPATRHFYLLHTVAKKTRKADSADVRRACSVLTRVLSGEHQTRVVELPAR